MAGPSGAVEKTAEGCLTDLQRKVLETLIEQYPNGAKQGEWQKATEGRGVSRASHFRAVNKLVSPEVSPHHRVRLVHEIYFPPDATDPPEPDETSLAPEDIETPEADEDTEEDEPRPRDEDLDLTPEEDAEDLEELQAGVEKNIGQTNETGSPNPDETSTDRVDTPDSGRSQEATSRPHEPDETTADQGGLTVAEVLAELDRPGSAPRIHLMLWRVGNTSDESLIKRVLEAKGLPTDEWESYAGVVQEAVRIVLTTGIVAR